MCLYLWYESQGLTEVANARYFRSPALSSCRCRYSFPYDFSVAASLLSSFFIHLFSWLPFILVSLASGVFLRRLFVSSAIASLM